MAVLNNLTRNPYAAGLAIDGEDGGTGAAYGVSMNHMGHPIASNIRDCYLNLVQVGMQNEIPLFAGGGVGKTGNLAANAAALIMLGASGVQIGKYIMQAAAGCLGSKRTAAISATSACVPRASLPRTRAFTGAWTWKRWPSGWWMFF
jgi:glutamate synthase (NADPH/NADH) large chain